MTTLSPSIARALLLLPASALVALAPACLFVPNLEQYGYTACAATADCPAGRTCAEGVCSPPEWHDEAFGRRQLLVVENNSDTDMEAGAVVPVLVKNGEGGVVTLDEVGIDFRFADFDEDKASWRVLPLFIDRQSDRLTVWTPLSRAVPRRSQRALAYIESSTVDGVPTALEDAVQAFSSDGSAFLGFDVPADALSPDDFFIIGAPSVADSIATVHDNDVIVFDRPFLPPVTATALVRFNGVTCDEVYIGFVGDDEARFETPPSAGMFVAVDLGATARLAPTADSQPTELGDSFFADNAFARYTVAVDGPRARLDKDGEVFLDETDLRPPFAADAPLFFTVEVGGACSVDLEAVWITKTPLPPPKVRAEAVVKFQLF